MVLFENLTLTEGDFPGLTFRNCRFTGCRISGIALERAAFIDCVLEHCDCSNVNLQKASLERTRLSDCKLVGATLSEAFLLDVSLIDCIARYSNFSSSKIRHTRFTDCDLSHAALGGCKLAKTAFERCLLIRAELFQTPFAGMDLSDCDISGIAISGEELRNARVNLEQAAQLGVLLAGVVPQRKRRCRAKPTDANPVQREQRFLDGSFVTLGCCFVIEFRAYYDTIPGSDIRPPGSSLQ